MPKLAIIGAGGHGKVVLHTALASGQYTLHDIIFVDNDFKKLYTNVMGITVAKSPHNLEVLRREFGVTDIFVAIGDNEMRSYYQDLAISIGYHIPIISWDRVPDYTTVGPGTLICRGAIVCTGAKIGQGCIINTSAIIEHDCVISEYSHIASGAKLAGGVQVGTKAFIGTGAIVLPRHTIGAKALVGAGAVVTKNIESSLTVVGCPARELTKEIRSIA
jgi:sugar O-acyltransferase (sialic acid O-acetyltransferase NeuD family)